MVLCGAVIEARDKESVERCCYCEVLLGSIVQQECLAYDTSRVGLTVCGTGRKKTSCCNVERNAATSRSVCQLHKECRR